MYRNKNNIKIKHLKAEGAPNFNQDYLVLINKNVFCDYHSKEDSSRSEFNLQTHKMTNWFDSVIICQCSPKSVATFKNQ